MPENPNATGNEVSQLDHNHPLFLQPSDSPGVVLIPLKLTGPENYSLWSRSMKMALLGKGKLGFIDGSCAKSMYQGDLAKQWDKCNAIVLSWIGSTVCSELMPSILFATNAKRIWEDFKERFDKSNLTRIYQLWNEIATLKQGTTSVTSYYSKMKDLWDELDLLVAPPSCSCEESAPYVAHLKQQRLLLFLMGLNESYSHVRSDLLLKTTVPTVNQAFSIVAQEESQRVLGVVEVNKEPLMMLAGKPQNFRNKYQGDKCKNCGCRGHSDDDCYKIKGFPADFVSKKKGKGDSIEDNKRQFGGQGNNANGGKQRQFRPYANNAGVEDDSTTSGSGNMSQGPFLTEEQYKQVVSMLNKASTASTAECSASAAGALQWQGIGDW